MVAASLNIEPVPPDYSSLSKLVLETVLAGNVAEISKWLSEVQTWVEVRSKNKNAPPLEFWLARGRRDKPIVRSETKKSVEPSLASAEAAVGEFKAEAEPIDKTALVIS